MQNIKFQKPLFLVVNSQGYESDAVALLILYDFTIMKHVQS